MDGFQVVTANESLKINDFDSLVNGNTVMPDLVIILSLSPFIEGLPFVEELRRHTLGRVPIYVIGWQQSERAVLSLLESGVDQYMTFPISLHRLYGKIRQRAESLGVNV